MAWMDCQNGMRVWVTDPPAPEPEPEAAAE